MKCVGVFVLAGLLGTSFSQKDTKFEVETVTEDDKRIMVLKNKETGMITEIDLFEKQKYQLVKPEDEDICYVVGLFVKAANGRDNPACYKGVHVSEGMQKKLLLDLSACEDREVVFLKPMGCRDSDYAEQGLREKRACLTKEEVIVVCVRYSSVCTKHGWWSCDRYENQCAEKDHRIVTTRTCS